MAIPIQCPKCNRPATVPDETAGKTVRCKCGASFVVAAAIDLADLETKPNPANVPAPNSIVRDQKDSQPEPLTKSNELPSGCMYALIGVGCFGLLNAILIGSGRSLDIRSLFELSSANIGLIIGLAIGILVFGGLLALAFIVSKTCPYCGKKFSAKVIKTVVEVSHLEVRKDTHGQSRMINVTPYDEHVICKHCRQTYIRKGFFEGRG